MKKSEITVLGSLNVDLTINLPRFHVPGETITGTAFHTFLGGKGGNQAVVAAKLGGKVHMIGCVGQDAYGDMYLKEMERLGIDAAHVRREQDAPTGTALIEVDAKGENRIAIVPGANAALNCDLVSDSVETIRASRVLMMQLETPIESINHAAAVAHKLGCTVILDPAPARPVGPEILLLCDYVTPNETELSILTGMPTATQEQAIDACAKLLDMGVKAVVHKRGSKGAMLATREGVRFFPACKVEAVDTTAAGDTFNAGFAVGLTMDMPVEDAIRLGNAAAALSTTGLGAQGAMPDLYSACALVEAN